VERDLRAIKETRVGNVNRRFLLRLLSLGRRPSFLSTYYKFKPTAGYSLAISADMTGANLPPVQYGRWALVEALEISPGDGTRFGPDADAILRGVREEGFYLWSDKRPPEG
jgi:hypothetical protein